MDILRMLADLRAGRKQVEEAILAIERLASGVSHARWPTTEMAVSGQLGRFAGKTDASRVVSAAD